METKRTVAPKKGVPAWIAIGVGSLVMVYLIIAIVDKGYGFSKQFINSKPENTISISAEGKVSATPDLATINLGVFAQAKTAALAQSDSSERINQIIEFVKKQGISADDIQTSNFNIYPRYEFKNGRNDVIGYDASQSVTVKIRDVKSSNEKIGTILAGATDNGANQVGGVTFSFDDSDGLRQDARKLAIDKAKQKAQELAAQTGLTLGKIVSISENGNGAVPPILFNESVGRGGADLSSVPSIQKGTQEVVQNVTVVFEVK